MDKALIVLIPISVMVIAGVVAILWWASRHGQFDDMEGPAHAILMDDDDPHANAEMPTRHPRSEAAATDPAQDSLR